MVSKTPVYFEGFKHKALLTFAFRWAFPPAQCISPSSGLRQRIFGLCGANGDSFSYHTLVCKLETCKPHKLPTTTGLLEQCTLSFL